ncbi:homeobox-leucine zipper protein HOX11-like isoform X2 [Prunus yedoensis var. nudiflora]|uniref:Homeobox-leucine zipper protein HOX11-like isoform X2 n=1 Tax=Prunus yedoensis var. nudiflora TaxID=2094558 RepID=A0A314XJZ6_PRUYE|nr:homeobox-leucine zipper protein HOX11-like isoform X2 [Prunus yedoensis var. nudiflora]
MELCLSLGDVQAPAEPFGLVSSSSSEKPRDDRVIMAAAKTTGFCMSLSIGPSCDSSTSTSPREADQQLDRNDHQNDDDRTPRSGSHGFPWPTPSDQNVGGGGGSSENVNRVEEVAAVSSSPTNSGASSFQMDIGLYSSNYRGSGGKRSHSPEAEGDEGERQSNSRASDEDDINGSNTRKKLRLSKEQSAFLEESFKEHHTLNPKQKLALAKQLNLRPRQVEVWFQNRRARTKLKQTEVDCEFLKRCCETLTEENRRLHKTTGVEGFEDSSSFKPILHAITSHNPHHVPFL